MEKKILIAALLLGCSFGLRAQQDPQFSHFMFNNLYNNPAYSGVEGVTKLTAIHRTQWLGYSGSFDRGGGINTQAITMSSPLLQYRAGVGMFIVNDNFEHLNNLQIQLSGAYHIAIKNSKLSIGVRSGIYSQTIDYEAYRAINPDDPLIGSGRDSQFRPDLSVGAFFQSEKFWAGLSFNHVIQNSFDFASDPTRNPLQNHFVLTAGYEFELNYETTIMPTFLARTDFASYTFDIGAVVTYQDKMWAGLTYRQQEAAIIMLGYSLLKDKSLRFGYAFDFTVIASDAKAATSHELMLSYTLPAVATSGKKVVRTPRFR